MHMGGIFHMVGNFQLGGFHLGSVSHLGGFLKDGMFDLAGFHLVGFQLSGQDWVVLPGWFAPSQISIWVVSILVEFSTWVGLVWVFFQLVLSGWFPPG